MKRFWIGLLVGAVLTLGLEFTAWLIIERVAAQKIAADIFVTYSKATATPASYGVPFQAFSFRSGNRVLQASLVTAGTQAPAVLIFHGNAETLHDWAGVQAWLERHGMSSMVFDYSGFGQSTGTPTIANLDQDAREAWREFIAKTPGAPHFALGFSLGTGVVLGNIPAFHPAPLGVMVYGTYSSGLAQIVYLGAVPPRLAFLLPNIWDNLSAVQRITVPLLIEDGTHDINVPYYMSKEVADAAGKRATFVPVHGVGHEAIIEKPYGRVWQPILKFMQLHARSAHGGAVQKS